MIEGLLDEIGAAVDPVHDLQRPAFAGVFGRTIAQPGPEGRGLLGVAEAEQRVDGERPVPDPGIAVVPVALAALLLGQPGGGRGDQGAGGRVGHQLERDRRAGDHLPPPSGVGGPVQPVAPEERGLVGQPLGLLGWHQPGRAPHGLQHHAADLACPQRPRPPHPVASALQRDVRVLDAGSLWCDAMHGQLQPVGLEHPAAVGELQLVCGTPVVEARLDLHREPHGAAYHPDVAHQPVPVGCPALGDGHEVVYLADPVGGHEPGDQDRGVGQVQLLGHVVVPVRPDLEEAAAVGIEQRCEHAG